MPHTATQRLSVRKKLRQLLNLPELPPQYKKYYWTTTALRQVLVACGVDDQITDSDVRYVLRATTSVGLADQRDWNNERYYCLDPSTKETPKDQHGMAIPAAVHEFWRSNPSGADIINEITTLNNKINNNEGKENVPPDLKRQQRQHVNDLPLDFAFVMPDGYRIVNNTQLGHLLNWCFNHHRHCKRPVCSYLELLSSEKDGFSSDDAYVCTRCG